jgi:hypothetical protein
MNYYKPPFSLILYITWQIDGVSTGTGRRIEHKLIFHGGVVLGVLVSIAVQQTQRDKIIDVWGGADVHVR